MTVLSLTDPVAGTIADATLIANNDTAIKAVINGGIDNNNFAAGKIFDNTKIMQGGATVGQGLVWDGTNWSPAAPTVKYRKTTAKVVNTTVAATDLLNGEVTIAAGLMGATGTLRLVAFGDFKNNSGVTVGDFRWQLLFGGTTLIDSGSGGFALENSATRYPWKVEVLITNTATNLQVVHFSAKKFIGSATAAGALGATTGEGGTYGIASSSSKSVLLTEIYNTGAKDTTGALALVLNVINPSANALTEFALASATVELL